MVSLIHTLILCQCIYDIRSHVSILHIMSMFMSYGLLYPYSTLCQCIIYYMVSFIHTLYYVNVYIWSHLSILHIMSMFMSYGLLYPFSILCQSIICYMVSFIHTLILCQCIYIYIWQMVTFIDTPYNVYVIWSPLSILYIMSMYISHMVSFIHSLYYVNVHKSYGLLFLYSILCQCI